MMQLQGLSVHRTVGSTQRCPLRAPSQPAHRGPQALQAPGARSSIHSQSQRAWRQHPRSSVVSRAVEEVVLPVPLSDSHLEDDKLCKCQA